MNLLVVDDEQSICWGLTRLGESMGLETVAASSAEAALELVKEQTPAAIVLDVRLPGMTGLQAMRQFRRSCGEVPIIVITAYGDLDTAVEAVRNGAFEYIVKPFDLEKVERVIGQALEQAQQSGVPAKQVPAKQVVVPESGLVGRSPAMQQVFRKVALAAAADASVLITGESGTGKELAARAVHEYSNRSSGPFVAVNVAALSPALAESELFGHARGSFTGAEGERSGLLVQAGGGTLFLDEVADIPLAVQVKLLRALELGEVVPVGANQPVKTDFRIVSATHRDLLERVRAEEFRHDLYFRLAAFLIEIPPLREHLEDIPELAEHFLQRAAGRHSGKLPQLTETALDELKRRPFKGNIRELRNAIDHAVIVARGGVINPQHLPEPLPDTSPGIPADLQLDQQISALVREWAEQQLADENREEGELYQEFLRMVEPALLQLVLEKHGDQYTAAARRLGMHRTTLRKKLDDYGLGN